MQSGSKVCLSCVCCVQDCRKCAMQSGSKVCLTVCAVSACFWCKACIQCKTNAQLMPASNSQMCCLQSLSRLASQPRAFSARHEVCQASQAVADTLPLAHELKRDMLTLYQENEHVKQKPQLWYACSIRLNFKTHIQILAGPIDTLLSASLCHICLCSVHVTGGGHRYLLRSRGSGSSGIFTGPTNPLRQIVH